MKKRNDPMEHAAHVYAALLRLYPAAYRRAFGVQILQTFKDQYRDVSEHGGSVGLPFWLSVVGDEVRNIAKEQIVAVRARRIVPMVMLVIGAVLFTGSAIFLIRGFSLKFLAIVMIVLLSVVSLVVRRSPQSGTSSPGQGERVWIKHGLRCGVLFGLLWVVFNLANNLAAYDSPLYNTSRTIAAILFIISMPVAFGLTGFISGRKSRAMRGGAFAGLLASVISSAIAVVSLAIIMLLFWGTIRYNAFQDPGMIGDWRRSGDQTFDQFLWDDNLGGAFFMTLFSLIFGGLLGTLGGALGASPPRKGDGAGAVIVQSGEAIG